MEEEAEVVNSIFEGSVEPWSEGVLVVHIPESEVAVRLRIPTSYPAEPPSIVLLTGRRDALELQDLLAHKISETFVPGEVYIYTFIDEAQQLLQTKPEPAPQVESVVPMAETKGSMRINEWTTTDPLIDRKSVFIGRAIRVDTEAEALELVQDLVQDKKIARATHNMMAYRIRNGELLTQDCDDDGESAAGGRMLHLLNITNASNVVVVVSRWFGGVLLGPDRFKHINSCAREALVKGGFIQ